MRLPRALRWAAIFWTTLFWIALVAVPLVVVASRAASGHIPLFDPVILKVASITLGQAVLSAGIAGAVGLPLGVWMGARGGKSVVWAEMFLALPFGVPTVVAGVAWVAILGRSGWLAQMGLDLDFAYTFKAVILAHAVFNIPWVALLVAQARLHSPEGPVDAARTLGASAWQRLRFVHWPEVRWAFASSVTQALAFCSMSFALILILGGGPPVQTLETALYSRIRYGSLDLGGALACAFWQLLITLIPWAAVVMFQARQEKNIRRVKFDRTSEARYPERRMWSFRPVVALLLFIPYLGSLKFVAPISDESINQIIAAGKVSLLIMVLTALATVLTALAAVVALESVQGVKARMAATIALNVPGGISALVLGLGLWLGYRRWIDPFEGSLFAMVALQTALFFTIAFRVLWPIAQRTQCDLVEAALSLGASPLEAFLTVEWPRWRSGLGAAAALVAGASLGEVAAVSLFYNERLIPLPLLISRLSAQYRFEEAQWIAGLLLVLSSVTIAAVYAGRRLQQTERRGFFA